MKTWFITGAGRGLGNVWARAALERGDRVVATARRPEVLKDLEVTYGGRIVALPLDVTDRQAVYATVSRAVESFGPMDVVVNNAGYGLFGMVEEASEKQARDQMETNFFGALWVTQAVLPVLRRQGSGHILQVSTIGGVAAFATLGLYNASKWALEGMSDALAKEVSSLGISVTLVEPGPYATDWSGSSAVHAEPIAAYEPVRAARQSGAAARAPEDPVNTVAEIMRLVDDPQPPLRAFLGSYPYPIVEKVYRERLEIWNRRRVTS